MSEITIKKNGRPTKYKPEMDDVAFQMASEGSIEAAIANTLGINPDTLGEWKKSNLGFSEALQRGKDIADSKVQESLYKRAVGYTHPAVKIFQRGWAKKLNPNSSDESEQSNDGEVPSDALIVPYTEHYPPDTNAASLWLRNRRKEEWRDQNQTEHTVNGEIVHYVARLPAVAENTETWIKLNKK